MSEIASALGGGLWSVMAFVIALSIIVAIHEYGHYIVARWSGIHAEVFSLGFGPVLLRRKDRRGTEWRVSALPLGGYVRFLGDSDVASVGPAQEVDPALRRRTLDGAPLWARVATVAAGPVFNFVLSIILFGAIAMFLGRPTERPEIGAVVALPPEIAQPLRAGDEIIGLGGQDISDWRGFFDLAAQLPEAETQSWTIRRGDETLTFDGPDPMLPVIAQAAPNSAAGDAGLRRGDVVRAVNGAPIYRFSGLREPVEASAGAALTLDIWRPGQGDMQVELAPRQADLPDGNGGFEKRWMIGVTTQGLFKPATESVGPVAAVSIGVMRMWSIVESSFTGMSAMITGQIDRCNLGGAISIAQGTGQAATSGLMDFVTWIAILSTAIGFLNLLPIPVLDGGHLAFYGYEAVTGRKPSERAMRFLTSIGLALVLGLMLFGLTNDLTCP